MQDGVERFILIKSVPYSS